MGCDCHMYVEHRPKEKKRDYDKEWDSFGARINPGRNYALFDAIAGVRGNELQLFKPRDIPDDLAYHASGDYWLYINYLHPDAEWEGSTSPSRAESYINSGCRTKGSFEPTLSQQGDVITEIGAEHRGKPTHVEHPDWHTHTWLTPQEFAAALDKVEGSSDWGVGAKYWALLAAMQELERRGEEVRIVIWFDN